MARLGHMQHVSTSPTIIAGMFAFALLFLGLAVPTLATVVHHDAGSVKQSVEHDNPQLAAALSGKHVNASPADLAAKHRVVPNAPSSDAPPEGLVAEQDQPDDEELCAFACNPKIARARGALSVVLAPNVLWSIERLNALERPPRV